VPSVEGEEEVEDEEEPAVESGVFVNLKTAQMPQLGG
jgi:hypothetical protein